MLAKIGVRATLLRSMGLWGLASAAMMFATTPTQFYVLRFLIGVFEAGFAPGVLFYLTLWFPSHRRAQATALFFMAFGAAPIVAGPIAGLTMTYLDGVLALRGWQWLFLLEGLPSVLLGLAAFRYLSNNPAQAPWLTAPEKQRVVLPPALKKVWPTMVSQIIIVMLGSAVCGQISTEELSDAANLIQSRNFRAFEAFIIATLIYLALSVALRRLLNWAGPKFFFGR